MNERLVDLVTEAGNRPGSNSIQCRPIVVQALETQGFSTNRLPTQKTLRESFFARTRNAGKNSRSHRS